MLVDPIYLSLFLRKDQKLQMLCFDRRCRRKKKRRFDETLINKNWTNEYNESNQQRETTKTQVYKVMGR